MRWRRPTRRRLLFRVLHGWFAALLLLACSVQANPLDNGAVATAHPLASEVGRQILEAGGNAFDATVAVSAALAVVEPYGSGLGGGGFFLLREAAEPARHVFLDARERAPRAATPDLYLRDGQFQRDLSLNGPLAGTRAMPTTRQSNTAQGSRSRPMPRAAKRNPNSIMNAVRMKISTGNSSQPHSRTISAEVSKPRMAALIRISAVIIRCTGVLSISSASFRRQVGAVGCDMLSFMVC